MGYLAVLVAAVAGFAFGAVWYMALQKPWMEAANIKMGEDGKPEGDSPLPYIMAAIAMILVAGMMRHVFALSEITTAGKGFISGLGGSLLHQPLDHDQQRLWRSSIQTDTHRRRVRNFWLRDHWSRIDVVLNKKTPAP